MNASCLGDALDCAERGWRVVVACGKNPGALLGAGWQHQATTDRTTIQRWFRRWPDANFGVVVGDSFIAFDIDPRTGADDALHGLELELGPLPTTPSYLTGGPDGGWRLLFEHPGGALRCDIGGIEVKRGNQMIVMPGSIHPETGHQYTWDEHVDEVGLAALPQPWLDRLRPPSRRPARASAEQRDDPLLAIDAATYIEALTGRVPDRRGYVQCPFHKGGQERRPDLKLYGTGWACFACQGPGPSGKLGGTIYQFAARLWGYPLPLRGPAFLAVQDRLLDVFTAHFRQAA